MQEQIPESARQVLDVLAEKLGVAGVDLWQAMIDKAALDAAWYWWGSILFGVFCAVAVIVAAAIGFLSYREGDEDIAVFGLCVFAGSVVLGLFSAGSYYWFFLAQNNPTYWALQEILRMAGRLK